MFRDYYKILNVERGANKEDIKKAFRRLALEWHPDRNKSPLAHAKFIEINEAYLILYDADARAKYDQEFDHYYSRSDELNTAEFYEDNQFNFRDDNLNRWSKNARHQAEKYASIPYEEFIKMIGVVVREVGIQGATAVVYAISGIVGSSAIFSLIEGVKFGDGRQIFLSIIFVGASLFGFAFANKKYRV